MKYFKKLERGKHNCNFAYMLKNLIKIQLK